MVMSFCVTYSAGFLGYLPSFPTRRSSGLLARRRQPPPRRRAAERVEEVERHEVQILVTLDFFDALGRTTTRRDRKSTRLNSSHVSISYAVFCLKKKKIKLSYFLLQSPPPH